MRKIVVCILLICFGFVSFAETQDLYLSDLDDVELYSLFNNVKNELAKRSFFDQETLWPGDYVVGIDIEPGRYSFTCIEVASPDREEGDIEMHPSVSDDRNIGYAKFFGNNSFDAGEEQRVELCDGEVLAIRYAIFLPVKIG